jgi:hypothetical protein
MLAALWAAGKNIPGAWPHSKLPLLGSLSMTAGTLEFGAGKRLRDSVSTREKRLRFRFGSPAARKSGPGIFVEPILVVVNWRCTARLDFCNETIQADSNVAKPKSPPLFCKWFALNSEGT